MGTQKILLNFEPRPENLLSALKEIQKENKHVGKSECEEVARYFSLPLARIFSTASFFDFIKTKKQSKKTIKICSGGSCLGNKSIQIVRQIELLLKIQLDNDANAKYKLEYMSCVGLCDRGPILMIDDQVFEKVRPETVDDIMRNYL